MPCYLSCICLIDTQSIPAIVLAIAAGITLIIICNALWHANSDYLPPGQQFLGLASVALIGAALILYPSFEKTSRIPNTKLVTFHFCINSFRSNRKSLIASLSGEQTTYRPFLSSILVGREYAIPYHVGYYRQFRQRMLALIRAQYSLDLVAVQTLIQSMV